MATTIPRGSLDPFYRYKRPVLKTKLGKANTTIIENLDDVSRALNRPSPTILSFMKTKLGTSGQKATLKGSFSTQELEDVLEAFIEKDVLCRVCGNPETVDGRCSACGNSGK